MTRRIAHLLAGESLPSETAPDLLGECQRVALILQGGGALGAYQAGAAEALAAAGYRPDWVAGISIGAINAALIVGNAPERRIDALRAFWTEITNDRVWGLPTLGHDEWRKWVNLASAAQTLTLGAPGFFTPWPVNPWFAAPGTLNAVSWYDTAALRATLERLVDFDRINQGPVRLSVGAVDVATGNFAYFDSKRQTIAAEHIMASGALPPGLPPVQIDGAWYWDGGLVSNTPLAAILSDSDGIDTLCFQVDLFPARGPLPQQIADVEQRRKDIQYSSRTRLNTDLYRTLYNMNARLRRIAALAGEEHRHDPDVLAVAAAGALGKMHVAHLIYRTADHALDSKDYEFSRTSMAEHWRNGLADTRAGLARPGWLDPLPAGEGLRAYDLTRPGETVARPVDAAGPTL